MSFRLFSCEMINHVYFFGLLLVEEGESVITNFHLHFRTSTVSNCVSDTGYLKKVVNWVRVNFQSVPDQKKLNIFLYLQLFKRHPPKETGWHLTGF
jgi:hypothetical protein